MDSAAIAKARLLKTLIVDQMATRGKARIAIAYSRNNRVQFTNPISVGLNDTIKFIEDLEGLTFVVTIPN